MSERTKNIIRSPEAEAFLRMVTKDFYADSYTGLWIYEVIGREWDDLRGWSEGLIYEAYPQTCTWSIDIWEWMYGIPSNPSLSLELRRQNLMAKIRSTKPINPETIRRGIASLIGRETDEVEVTDFVAPYRFKITITASPEEYRAGEMYQWVRTVKPSHLAFNITVETEADIEGRISAAAAVMSSPKTVITNSQTFDDLGLQGEERAVAATMNHPVTIITNNAGHREEAISASSRMGAATVQNAHTIITNNQDTESESIATAHTSAGTVTAQRLIITNHPQRSANGTARAASGTGAVTSHRTIIT